MTYPTTHCFFPFTVNYANKSLLFTLDNFKPVFNNTFDIVSVEGSSIVLYMFRGYVPSSIFLKSGTI